MPERSSKKRPQGPPDINSIAFRVMQEATAQAPKTEPDLPAKNPAAVALGKLGGAKGGPARAAKLSKKKRSEIASVAASARWKKS